jgi:hypothetical protein
MREARLPAQQPIYRVRQFVFCLVERAFGCYSITLARLVGCEDGFLRCDPFPGSIKDCEFGIFHEPILAALNIGVGAVSCGIGLFGPICVRIPQTTGLKSTGSIFLLSGQNRTSFLNAEPTNGVRLRCARPRRA